MKEQEYDGNAEKEVLTAMIVNPVVASRLTAKWGDGNKFASPWANEVGGWVVKHWRKHQAPLRNALRNRYERWAERQRDEAKIELVERFLLGLSSEYEKMSEDINPGVILDTASNLFAKVAVQRMIDAAASDLAAGNPRQAEERFNEYHRVDIVGDAGVDLFNDEERVRSAFNKENVKYVKFPGALGQFFGTRLRLGNFISFLGGEKSGKSFWLMNTAWQALQQRWKVAHFTFGDMNEDEVIQRYLVRTAEWPDESEDDRWPYVVDFPTSIEPPVDDDDIATVRMNKLTFTEALDGDRAWRACRNTVLGTIKSKKPYFMMATFPPVVASVNTIQGLLESWKPDFSPDCIVVDYADNMAPLSRKSDKLDQINETWMALRALSQTSHSLILTATQSTREGYDRRLLDRRHIGNDKRKLAQVTGFVGINFTGPEKDGQIQRLNWFGNRKGAYSVQKCVHVANCLPLANTAVVSTWGGRFEKDEDRNGKK